MKKLSRLLWERWDKHWTVIYIICLAAVWAALVWMILKN
jgi:hypothetical protein